MSDTLFTEPQRDQFQHESPIRAFTDWSTQGHYAIGKGFRPSVQHLVSYLDAMERKENWQVVQVLDAGNGLTILFRQAGLKIMPEPCGESSGEPIPYDAEKRARFVYDNETDEEPYVNEERMAKFVEAGEKMDAAEKIADSMDAPAKVVVVYDNEETNEDIYKKLAVGIKLKDDPVNPKHYAGTACAEIGELLSANSYQVLKYIWRLGEKDDPVIELGKALWYLDRERKMFPNGCKTVSTKIERSFLATRLQGKSGRVAQVVAWLVSWHHYGKRETLKLLEDFLTEMKENIELDRERTPCIDLGRGQEP